MARLNVYSNKLLPFTVLYFDKNFVSCIMHNYYPKHLYNDYFITLYKDSNINFFENF
jgi:hypothetical protein